MIIAQHAECIYNWLLNNNRPVVPLLQKGLGLADVMSITDGLDITLTNEVVELYKWRNGTSKDKGYVLGDVDFFPGFHFLPLEHAVSYYQSFINDNRWNKCWFPVFANGGGDFFVVNCTQEFKESSEVVGFMRDFDDHDIEYLSLEIMLQTFCECYTKGVFYLNEEGYITSKMNEEAIISNRLNPGLDRWLSEV